MYPLTGELNEEYLLPHLRLAVLCQLADGKDGGPPNLGLGITHSGQQYLQHVVNSRLKWHPPPLL